VLNQPRNWVMPYAYWGQEYSEAECKAFLDEKGRNTTHYDGKDDLMLDVLAES